MTAPRASGAPTGEAAYRERDLTFYLQVYRDHERALWCLETLRRVYPRAAVLVISDGDPDPRHHRLVERFGVRYIEGERLYPTAHGGRMISRFLERFLERPTRYLIKIDTDTCICRRFRFLPADADLFGDWARRRTRALQGGCVGFSGAAAETLLRSGLLDSQSLCEPRESWARDLDGSLMPDCLERAETLGLISFEFVLAWCSNRLGLDVRRFEEIRSEWKQRVSNPGLRYAVLHPIKDTRSTPEPGGAPNPCVASSSVETPTRTIITSAGEAPT